MSTKQPISLEPQQRSDAAVKRLLSLFLNIMEANESGILQDFDPECLHDFRVAVRRSRALLTQVPEVIPQGVLNRFKIDLAHIGAETTPQRDLDVMLLNFDDYRVLLSLPQREYLEPVFQVVKMHRDEAYRRSRQLLQSARYRRFKTQATRYLTKRPPARTALRNARRPIIEVANERIWKCYRRVLKQGNAITDDSPADDLHTVRKSCKKLRYLIEFFAGLYPKAKVKHVIGVLKQLQDMLGEHQDLCVHHQFFIDLQLQMRNENALPPTSDQVLDQIIDTLAHRQRLSRVKFQEAFRDFTGHHHHRQYKTLFRPTSAHASEASSQE